jgi:hypothetical protein
MESPVWIYYQLQGFFQNHRRYITSFSEMQLNLANDPGREQEVARDIEQHCQPALARERDDRVLYPCGLVPTSIFTDTIVLLQEDEEVEGKWTRIAVDSEASSIAWSADVAQGKFKNLNPEGRHTSGHTNQVALDMWILEQFPPVECQQVRFSDDKPYVPVFVAKRREESPPGPSGAKDATDIVDCAGFMEEPTCNFTRNGEQFTCSGDYELVRKASWGVESGHLMVWMRVAGLPSFRKLWGRVNTKLTKGSRYKVYVHNTYPVIEYNGKKALVFASTSGWGGRNDRLGWGFVFIGVCCLIFCCWRSYHWWYYPRELGDISFLYTQ